MTFQLVWHADPEIQQAVELLDGSGLMLEVSDDGIRAATRPQPSTGRLIGRLVEGGFRLGRQPLCVECGQPYEQVCSECVERSGLPEVGEERQGQPGRLEVVR